MFLCLGEARPGLTDLKVYEILERKLWIIFILGTVDTALAACYQPLLLAYGVYDHYLARC